MSNLHKLYIYTQTFSIFIFFIQTVSLHVTRHPIHFHISMEISALRNYTVTSCGPMRFLRNVTTRRTFNRGNLVPILSSRIGRSINERSGFIDENKDEKRDELDWVTAFREDCGQGKRGICTWKWTTSEVNEFGSC